MVKEEKIEKIIKQGLEYCGSSFKDVRYFLIKALEELKKEKRKNKKEKIKRKNVFFYKKINITFCTILFCTVECMILV